MIAATGFRPVSDYNKDDVRLEMFILALRHNGNI